MPPNTTVKEPGPPRSRRGQSRYAEAVLTPLEQIPVVPGNDTYNVHGAWAYYLRPDGATIADTLILYPNGGTPDMADSRMRGKFAENADYYQARQRRKGFEYIGQQLTEAGVKRLVEIMGANREDEILYCEDEMAQCQYVANTADRPEIRDGQRKRRDQFSRRLEYLRQPLDPEALVAELSEIARAQQLAHVDPNVLQVMRAMIGEVNSNMAAAISRFQAGRGASQPGSLSAGAGTMGDEFVGKRQIEL